MIDARIVLKKAAFYLNEFHVVLIVGLRRVYLPDSGGFTYATSKTYAIKRARWWSERTGIPFEEPTND